MSAICSVSLAAADQTPDDPDAAYRFVICLAMPIRATKFDNIMPDGVTFSIESNGCDAYLIPSILVCLSGYYWQDGRDENTYPTPRGHGPPAQTVLATLSGRDAPRPLLRLLAVETSARLIYQRIRGAEKKDAKGVGAAGTRVQRCLGEAEEKVGQTEGCLKKYRPSPFNYHDIHGIHRIFDYSLIGFSYPKEKSYS